ncbi:hypothetical protein LEP1GSC039_1718 [Leptospira santarosai str. 2000027870]|nr:hypothetical protein LEP1GSC039_1718 [Leptospira santarosai str. 2000027870]
MNRAKSSIRNSLAILHKHLKNNRIYGIIKPWKSVNLNKIAEIQF